MYDAKKKSVYTHKLMPIVTDNDNSDSVLFIYLGFYIAFNTVQVISRWVVGRAEEINAYNLSGLCTVNCRPTASNYPGPRTPASEVGGESVTTLPPWPIK